MRRSKYTRPAWLREQGEGGQGTADQPRLTTSAMIASLVAALQQHLVAAHGQMEDMAQQRGESEQALAALASNRNTLAPEIEKLEQQRAQVQQGLAKLTDEMAARNRELADVNGRLQAAQQELADLQSKLADILQQLGSSPLPAQQPGPSSGGDTDQALPTSQP
jgi:septal ring factor EnvC (AmiA/AmiB activator)